MRLSRESRYAIEALSALATRPPGELVEARELAAEADLPAPFLSKIMRRLASGGVISSVRGRGYRLDREATIVSLSEILAAVEGNDVIWETCIFWREECDTQNPCPLHFQWAEIKPGLQSVMGSITLADIRDNGLAEAARHSSRRDPD